MSSQALARRRWIGNILSAIILAICTALIAKDVLSGLTQRVEAPEEPKKELQAPDKHTQPSSASPKPLYSLSGRQAGRPDQEMPAKAPGGPPVGP